MLRTICRKDRYGSWHYGTFNIVGKSQSQSVLRSSTGKSHFWSVPHRGQGPHWQVPGWRKDVAVRFYQSLYSRDHLFPCTWRKMTLSTPSLTRGASLNNRVSLLKSILIFAYVLIFLSAPGHCLMSEDENWLSYTVILGMRTSCQRSNYQIIASST